MEKHIELQVGLAGYFGQHTTDFKLLYSILILLERVCISFGQHFAQNVGMSKYFLCFLFAQYHIVLISKSGTRIAHQ